MDEYIATPNYFAPWDHRMTYELALALDPVSEILARYHVTEKDFQRFRKQPAFMQQIVDYRAEIREKGLTFRAKAKIMAEDLLGTAYELIHSPATPANVKADLIKWTSKVAALDPQPNQHQQDSNQFLPAIASAIKQLSDGDLELRVMQLVSKKQVKDANDGQVIEVLPS